MDDLGVEISFDNKEYWEQRIETYLKNNHRNFEETYAVWQYFKHCLQTQNRFFFENPLISLIIAQFKQHRFTLSEGTRIYRARLDEEDKYAKECWALRRYNEFQKTNENDILAEYCKYEAQKFAKSAEFKEILTRNAEGFEGFNAKESGVPPFEKVNAGRCNPQHVAFLYAASDKQTAAAEIRPFVKDSISIAKLAVKKEMNLVDFYYESDENGIRSIDDCFFDRMRIEYSLVNKGNKEEYLVTQYLSLLAQHQGFDGIRFRSSLVENGENYVIFNPENCEAISSKIYILRKVEYNLSPILQEDEEEVK